MQTIGQKAEALFRATAARRKQTREEKLRAFQEGALETALGQIERDAAHRLETAARLCRTSATFEIKVPPIEDPTPSLLMTRTRRFSEFEAWARRQHLRVDVSCRLLSPEEPSHEAPSILEVTLSYGPA